MGRASPATQTVHGHMPRPPNVALLRALWSPIDGIWGVLKVSWEVLVLQLLKAFHSLPQEPREMWALLGPEPNCSHSFVSGTYRKGALFGTLRPQLARGSCCLEEVWTLPTTSSFAHAFDQNSTGQRSTHQRSHSWYNPYHGPLVILSTQ